MNLYYKNKPLIEERLANVRRTGNVSPQNVSTLGNNENEEHGSSYADVNVTNDANVTPATPSTPNAHSNCPSSCISSVSQQSRQDA